jgi:hypothetical protein
MGERERRDVDAMDGGIVMNVMNERGVDPEDSKEEDEIAKSTSCLIFRTKVEGIENVQTVGDTGSAITLLGNKLLQQLREKGVSLKKRPLGLTIRGISSEAPISATGCVTLRVAFGNQQPIQIAAVLVEDWNGGLLLGWRTLRQLGFSISYGAQGTPRVRLGKLGVELEVEEEKREEVLVAREMSGEIDREI